jgi:hypothetical protein
MHTHNLSLQGSEQEYMSLHESSASGIKYPFEYEQRAIHYIFQTDKWQERNLPKYKPFKNYAEEVVDASSSSSSSSSTIQQQQRSDSGVVSNAKIIVDYSKLSERELEKALWRHVEVLPQCRMNSYFIYPSLGAILFHQSDDESYIQAQWVAGDFVVHMAGHKGNNKRDLFDYCLKMKDSFSSRTI